MPSWRNILGISAYYHDAAAALVCDGEIAAAAHEERFTRKKNDSDFPRQAIAACLGQAKLYGRQLDAVVFYDKPILKFARILETYLAVAPRGWRTFPTVISNWLGEKLDLRGAIRKDFENLAGGGAGLRCAGSVVRLVAAPLVSGLLSVHGHAGVLSNSNFRQNGSGRVLFLNPDSVGVDHAPVREGLSPA